MVNMSYCRFYNTNLALAECLDALGEGCSLSKEEFNSCKRIFKNFIEFCCNEGIVEDENGELDERMQEFFETIKTNE